MRQQINGPRNPFAVGMWMAIVGLVAAPGAQAAMGRTAGNFDVSPTGSATYQIPVWMPKGPNGVQPSLSIAYDSNSGDGTMGPGWFISGLGGISRCNKTYAQDSNSNRIALSVNDGYCLNGNRLRLTGGAYGTAGSTYQTELADFSNITANGTAGNGPGSFTAKGKDGLIYEYGDSNDGGSTYPSRISASGTSTPYLWLLNKVRDRAGNKYAVTYGAGAGGSTGVGVPLSISYTPSSAGSSTYEYTVSFAYTAEVLAGTEARYIAGGNTINANRLTSISIAHGATTVRKYVFGYGASPSTGRFRLTSVTECADAGQTNCLSPTNITYQDGTAGISSTVQTSSAAVCPGYVYSVNPVDLDNDGYPELVCYAGSYPQHLYVSAGTASGFSAFVDMGVLGQTDVYFDDFMGDGVKDFLRPSGNEFYRYRWNGSSFTATPTGVSVTPSGYPAALFYLPSDANGDGLADLVWSDVNGIVYTRLNTTSGGVLSFSSTNTVTTAGSVNVNASFGLSSHYQGKSGSKLLDFNGDGRGDFIMNAFSYDPEFYTSYYSSYTIITGDGGSSFGPLSGTENPSGIGAIDWNDDECTDVIDGGTGYVYLSKCDGTSEITSASSVGGIAFDWNGDGRQDRIGDYGGFWGGYLNTGVGTSPTPFTSSVPVAAGMPIVLDKNKDGLDDLAFIGSSGVTFQLHNGASTQPDLVTSITDGYGVAYSPTYVSISQSGIYSDGGSLTFPEQPIKTALYVVSQFTASDGIGGTYTKTYSYVGARKDVRGRDFLGFQQQNVADSRSGAPLVKSYFKTAFPYTGMLYQQDIFQNNGTTTISHTVNTPGLATLDATTNSQRYFPNIASTTTDTYEVGGAKNGALVTQRSTSLTYDSYGNVTGATETLTDKDSTAPASPTYNQAWTTTVSNSFTPDSGTNWCVSIPTLTTINRATTGSSITRTTSFTPDYANCRVTQKIVEPSSGSYKVTTGYGYDSFGNVSSETVTGIGMTARQTLIGWGATGQFPVSVTNALGQVSSAGYNYDLGFQTTATDANGLAASFTPDAFGRRTRETRIDGTYTDFTYTDCTASTCRVGDPAGSTAANKMVVTAIVKDSGGTTIRDDYLYLDQFDRVIVTMSRLLGSTYSRVGTQFDAFGNVYRQTAPCNATSCSVYWTTNSYDALNRVTNQSRPISATVSTLQSTSYSYQGLTTIFTDPMGKLATKIVDPNGWLRRSKDHDNYYQDFNYDAFGSLKTVTDSLSNALFSANYVYGIDAFQTSKTDIDLGAWTFTPNALGEVTAYTDAKAGAFTQTFDALSRMTTRFVTGEGTTTFTYGANAANYNIGQIASISKTAGTIEEYTYDNKSRLSQRKITSDAIYYYDYTYGTHGQLDTLTYPTSTSSYRLRLKHLYANGILQQVKDDNASTVFWQANATDFRGQISQQTLGNNVITNRAFDAVTGRISTIQSGVGGGSALQNESYLTDLVGNVTQRQQNNLGLTEDFFYDNVYRLTQSKLNAVTNLTVAYNVMGNITSRSDVAGGATWTYDATRKHAVTQAGSTNYTYTYDGNGNAQTRNGASVSWSKYNYPTVINGPGKILTFEYDANNQRFRQTYNNGSLTETTVYVGGLLEKTTVGTSVDWRHYIKVGTQAIAVMSRQSSGTNTTRYVLGDVQGSVANITDAAGASYVAESFTAFGQRRNPATWSGPCPCPDLAKIAGVSRIGYTGHEAIGGISVGLNHMNGRVQDAITGRFLSADPYITEPGNTQGYNRYSYVMNNPMTFTDPSGFCSDVDTGYDAQGNLIECIEVVDSRIYDYQPNFPIVFSLSDFSDLLNWVIGDAQAAEATQQSGSDATDGRKEVGESPGAHQCFARTLVSPVANAVGGAAGGAAFSVFTGQWTLPQIAGNAVLGAAIGVTASYANELGDATSVALAIGSTVMGRAGIGEAAVDAFSTIAENHSTAGWQLPVAYAAGAARGAASVSRIGGIAVSRTIGASFGGRAGVAALAVSLASKSIAESGLNRFVNALPGC